MVQTDTGHAAQRDRRRVLVVVTSDGMIDGRPLTGVWFEEFAIPYQVLRQRGFDVTMASPRGGVIDTTNLLQD